MAERIHRRRSRPWVRWFRQVPAWVYALGVTVAVILAGVVYTVVEAGSPTELSYQLIGFTARSGVVAVTYEVDKAPLTTVQCTLVAQDQYHQQVGVLVTTIGPNSHQVRSTEHTVLIHLAAPTDQAVTAFISGCRVTVSGLVNNGPIPGA